MSKKITGPDGTEYNSISEMCRHYNVRYNVYNVRRSRGYTQAQALGIEKDFTIAHPVTGPDGVTYKSISEAARAFDKKANRNKWLKTHILNNNFYDVLRLKTVEKCHANLPSEMILARYFYAIIEMCVSSITG